MAGAAVGRVLLSGFRKARFLYKVHVPNQAGANFGRGRTPHTPTATVGVTA